MVTARNTLKVFDARNGQLSATVDLDGAFLGDAQAVAVDKTTQTAYVTETSVMQALNGRHGAVAVVGANHKIAGTVPVDGRPHGVAVNSQTHTVFVADVGGTVSVIDGSTRQVVQVVRGRAINPRGDLAYDAAADRLYVTDSQRRDVTVLGRVACGASCHAGGG